MKRGLLFKLSLILASFSAESALSQERGPPPPNGFSHEYATVRSSGEDVRIHHVIGGKKDGDPLLLIPSWPQTWYSWRHVMPELAKSYRVVAAEPRGMGGSERPKSNYDSATMGEDLHQLMRSLGYSKYSIVGHDIGLWTGYAIAADHPEAVKLLAVTEGSIPGIANFQELLMSDRWVPFRWHFLFNRLNDLPEALTAGKEGVYLSYIMKSMSLKIDSIALDEYIRAYSEPGALRAGFEVYRAFDKTITQNQARQKVKLTLPVLAMGADHSAGEATSIMMKSVAVNVEGHVLPECGHYPTEECPDVFLDRLLPFLKKNLGR